MPTDREQILETLADHRQELADRYRVKHLALFGSAARDELRDDSDIDVLIEFGGPTTYDSFQVAGLSSVVVRTPGRPRN